MPTSVHNNDILMTPSLDAVVVGAGFAGLYQLYSLREKLGWNVKVLEAGEGVGGTWYWNRYPGARCDSESHTYCYYFSDELLKEWEWSERYPGQKEILKYLNFCADRLNLKQDILFDERVCSATWNEHTFRWEVKTQSGLLINSKYFITAVGCLSSTNMPNITGMSSFGGAIYHTGKWPHKSVDFSNKSVVVIGTGSTGIQAIPIIAETAKDLTVLQRTPNFSVPARNAPLEPGHHFKFCREIETWRTEMMKSRHGHPWTAPQKKLWETPKKEREKTMEKSWEVGGLSFRESFNDILLDDESNRIMSDFIREKIRKTVHDPDTAEKLIPIDHPFGTKRPPIDTNYFETFNREHVKLIDIRNNPIECFNTNGLILSDGKPITADIVIFATGFDAMSGALLNMGVQGRGKLTLHEAWKEGPKTYLGLAIHGFPNMLTITGPGSPSVLTNMPRSIEQHVDWITAFLNHCENSSAISFETEETAMIDWTELVTAEANRTLLPKANHSWYLGANVPGKPRVFMPYCAGLDKYRMLCHEVTEKGYPGFYISI